MGSGMKVRFGVYHYCYDRDTITLPTSCPPFVVLCVCVKLHSQYFYHYSAEHDPLQLLSGESSLCSLRSTAPPLKDNNNNE